MNTAAAAETKGWDRARWGMTSSEIAAAMPGAAPEDDGGLTRRLLIRYAPPGQAEPACPAVR